MEKITKAQIKDFVKSKLGSDPEWAKRALLRIFEFQTIEEQKSKDTMFHNGVGFTGTDGKFLSSMATQLIKKKYLSDKQMEHLFNKMPKYWAQVIKVADKEKLHSMIR